MHTHPDHMMYWFKPVHASVSAPRASMCTSAYVGRAHQWVLKHKQVVQVHPSGAPHLNAEATYCTLKISIQSTHRTFMLAPQALSSSSPYLPRASDGSAVLLPTSPEAALLDRHFRLLREDVVGPLRAELAALGILSAPQHGGQHQHQDQRGSTPQHAQQQKHRPGLPSSRNLFRSVEVLGVYLTPRPCVMLSLGLPPGHKALSIKSQKDRQTFWEDHGKGTLPSDALVCLVIRQMGVGDAADAADGGGGGGARHALGVKGEDGAAPNSEAGHATIDVTIGGEGGEVMPGSSQHGSAARPVKLMFGTVALREAHFLARDKPIIGVEFNSEEDVRWLLAQMARGVMRDVVLVQVRAAVCVGGVGAGAGCGCRLVHGLDDGGNACCSFSVSSM